MDITNEVKQRNRNCISSYSKNMLYIVCELHEVKKIYTSVHIYLHYKLGTEIIGRILLVQNTAQEDKHYRALKQSMIYMTL